MIMKMKIVDNIGSIWIVPIKEHVKTIQVGNWKISSYLQSDQINAISLKFTLKRENAIYKLKYNAHCKMPLKS